MDPRAAPTDHQHPVPAGEPRPAGGPVGAERPRDGPGSAATCTPPPLRPRGTRLIIGDVRGKGLAAVGDAALVPGAFRAAAHQKAELPGLVDYLEAAVSADLDGAGDQARAS